MRHAPLGEPAATALGSDQPTHVVDNPVERLVPQPRIRQRGRRVERDVEIDGTPEQLLNVPVRQNLPVRRHLERLPAIAERVEQIIEIKLTPDEDAALKKSAAAVKELVDVIGM